MSTLRTPRIMVLAALAALSALVMASTSALAQSQSAGRAGAVVSLRNTAVGNVLAGASGRTLYLYSPDKKNKSTCYGQCASFWPPYLTSGKPRAGKGVKASLLGQTTRKDG
ncbi:MAG: COG4315 family predicted lipoprotein, partial [Gaiellaceae bacterium]